MKYSLRVGRYIQNYLVSALCARGEQAVIPNLVNAGRGDEGADFFYELHRGEQGRGGAIRPRGLQLEP